MNPSQTIYWTHRRWVFCALKCRALSMVLILMVGGILVGNAAEKTAAKPQEQVTAERVKQALLRLGANDFKQRKQATEFLGSLSLAHGKKYLGLALDRFFANGDPEVQFRLLNILEEWSSTVREPAFFGIQMDSLPVVNREQQGDDKTWVFAVKVKEVVANTPAERAGMKADDAIVMILENGKEIRFGDRPSLQFVTHVQKQRPGDLLRFKYLRDGEIKQLTVELGRWPVTSIDDSMWSDPTFRDRYLTFEVWLEDQKKARGKAEG